MEEILTKLDNMIKNMDYCSWSIANSHLTDKELIELTKFIRLNTNIEKQFYIDNFIKQENKDA